MTDHRLVIGIDYGTLHTGIAYATPSTSRAILDEIDIVSDWGPQMGNHDKIPSVISYSEPSRAQEQQWGYSISPDAITMTNTKLELDIRESRSEELDMILQGLDGMNNLHFNYVEAANGHPEYTWKPPEDIVTDYLTKIFQYISLEIKNFSPELRALIPVDIVITIPAKWSYRAQNSLFRAVNKAGFNKTTFPNLKDIIMVTEPQAAAIYSARYLRENIGHEFLRNGECFVLCDASEETVDMMSYKVMQLEPTLELEAASLPTSARGGSNQISAAFKSWLKETIGERNYQHLDPRNARQRIGYATEGREMKYILQCFESYWKRFSRSSREIRLDLPEPLDDITIGVKVVGGELTIANHEMRSFFDPYIEQIVEMIQGQILQVERKGGHVNNVFLIEYSSESPYLQQELKRSLGMRGIQLGRPDASWTAVVRGAVIYGIEKLHHSNLITMTDCPRSFGITLGQANSATEFSRKNYYIDTINNTPPDNQQLVWLIRKGDLLLSSEPKTAEQTFAFTFRETDNRRLRLYIYEYSDDDIPTRFQNSEPELKEVFVLSCDFTHVPISEFSPADPPRNGPGYYMAQCKCRMELNGDRLSVFVMWNEVQMCSVQINVI